MPNPTPELGLLQALDGDDAANYLDTSLANSLFVVDALFNNISGHTHGAVHQGGPISAVPVSAIPDGSITSAKLTDGTIQTIDLADGLVTTPKLADGAVTTAKIPASITLTTPTLTNATLNSPTINNASESSPTLSNPTISGTISGNATFNQGPSTIDWFHAKTLGQGLINDVTGMGVGFDAGGPFVQGRYAGGHLITETATQTLSNKTFTSPTIGGTVAGTPTWASPQAFPAGNHVGGLLEVGSNNGTDWKIDGGAVFFNAIPNAAGTQLAVTFSVAFAVAPTVVVTLRDSSSTTTQIHLLGLEVRSITTTGFGALVDNATGGSQSVTVEWIAFGH